MKKIRLLDYGILPDTDVTLALCEMFNNNPRDTEFIFEDADYYFSPHEKMQYDYRISNSDTMPYRVLGVWLRDMENCTLTGNGARLYYDGHMQAVTMDHCKNITMRDFVIDWKKPLVAEGIVANIGEKYVDLYVDPIAFPHRFTGSNIEFDVGNDEWYERNGYSVIQFDEGNLCVRRMTGDRFNPTITEELGNNVYRFHTNTPVDTNLGNVFVLRHNERIHAGIFTEKCENIRIEDVVVHSCGGLGCLGQFCHNLTYSGVHFIPNTKAGRKICGGRDDGMHLTSNSGKIVIENCTFVGLMDDPINVHGCSCAVDGAVDEYTLKGRFGHPQARGFYYWAEKGDEITFIKRGEMSQVGSAKAAFYELVDIDTFLLRFDEPIPEYIRQLADKGLLSLDNYTHTAEFECRNNRFGSCRARGMLISTPKPVLVENNYFASSGSAIVIPGDAFYWYESGECHDVEIRNNIFTDPCLSSYYGDCEGIISIAPQVPEPDIDKPYHKNIRITGNVFDTADTPVLYAYSVKDLTFKSNRIFKSPAAPKWHSADCKIKLRYCVNADVSGNEWIGKFDLKDDVVLDGENVDIVTD